MISGGSKIITLHSTLLRLGWWTDRTSAKQHYQQLGRSWRGTAYYCCCCNRFLPQPPPIVCVGPTTTNGAPRERVGGGGGGGGREARFFTLSDVAFFLSAFFSKLELALNKETNKFIYFAVAFS